jgi:hypothetical protein
LKLKVLQSCYRKSKEMMMMMVTTTASSSKLSSYSSTILTSPDSLLHRSTYSTSPQPSRFLEELAAPAAAE